MMDDGTIVREAVCVTDIAKIWAFSTHVSITGNNGKVNQQ